MKTTNHLKTAAKSIRKSNKAFGRMTAGQKRVAIARDALKQLDAEKIKAEHRVYVMASKYTQPIPMGNWRENPYDQQFRDIVCDPKFPTCRVCARGALFLSTVRKFNDVTVQDLGCDVGHPEQELDTDNFSDYEAKYFSQKQIDLIEGAFEGERINNVGNSYPDYLDYVFDRYYNQYGSADERLRAILKNIIRNDGTFVLPEKIVKAGKAEFKAYEPSSRHTIGKYHDRNNNQAVV